MNHRESIRETQDEAKALEVLHLPEVRVSCASLIRIQDSQGRIVLLVNKNRAKKGEFVLTPIGGGIEATEEGLRTLQQLLDMDALVFEKVNDLRFRMDGARANELRTWFLERQQREIDPAREVVEELVDESALLEKKDLEHLECAFVGYNAELEATTRAGQEGQMTLRLLEIFEVKVQDDVLAKLKTRSADPNASLRFVASEEIQNGQTEDGTRIGAVSQALLKPKATIEPFV